MNKNRELFPYYKKGEELLNYDANTGVFTRKVYRGGQPIGSIADNKHHSGYKNLYISVNGKGKSIASHRMAWFITYGEMPNIIDHIDMDKSNNKLSNLRECNHSQNNMNRINQKNNTSSRKGVHWHKRNKCWMAVIKINGKQSYLGSTKSFEEACTLRDNAEIKHHGEFMNNKFKGAINA